MKEEVFEAVEIARGVYWVGVIDWDLREFHGFSTPRGSTYNAYLVEGSEGWILIDGVKRGFEDQLISRVESVTPFKNIKALISNHAEMDHSGGIPYLMYRMDPDAKLYASVMGVKALNQHFHWDREVVGLKTGTEMVICGRKFQFTETRMIHWPDSMFTYLEDVGVIFTNDAFGMHVADSRRFSHEYDLGVLREECMAYYANILTPYTPQLKVLLNAMVGWDLDFKLVAPDHGPIWSENHIEDITGWYHTWANYTQYKKAVVAYATMWGSTRKMAYAIADGLTCNGIACTVMDVSHVDRSEIATRLLESSLLVMGTPTLNGQMFPRMADILTYIKGLRFKPKMTAAFGSHGWAGKGADSLYAELTQLGPSPLDPIKACYVPTEEVLLESRKFGAQLAASLQEVLK